MLYKIIPLKMLDDDGEEEQADAQNRMGVPQLERRLGEQESSRIFSAVSVYPTALIVFS